MVRTTAVVLSISQEECMAANTTVSQAKVMVSPVKDMANPPTVSQDMDMANQPKGMANPTRATEECQAKVMASPATMETRATALQATEAPETDHQTDTATNHTEARAMANSLTAT